VIQDQGIARELSLGEVISKTFELYRRNFTKYFVLFAIVGGIIGIATTLATNVFISKLQTPPINPTLQQILAWLSGLLGPLLAYIAVLSIVYLVFYPVAEGGTIKMTSEMIEKGTADLGQSVKFAISKLIWMWALGLVVGIIVILGYLALLIPGIILEIMFSLALPALLVENTGVIGSMGRSRELVSHRWLKTFATFLVLVIIIIVFAVVLSLVTIPFGPAAGIVSSILSAFYSPLVPIALTVYFYSNRARISPSQTGQQSMAPTAIVQPGMKFCPQCGAQLDASAMFCPRCGARQAV
jgi:hypothetical protein